MAIVIIARWFPRPNDLDRFLELVGGLADHLTDEMRASIAALLPTINREGAVTFVEKWSDESVMNKFRASGPFHQAMRGMSAHCHRPLEIEHLDTVDDTGEFASLRPMDPRRYPPGKADPRFYPDLGDMTPIYV